MMATASAKAGPGLGQSQVEEVSGFLGYRRPFIEWQDEGHVYCGSGFGLRWMGQIFSREFLWRCWG